jgi:hypothetical protein
MAGPCGDFRPVLGRDLRGMESNTAFDCAEIGNKKC